jgi:hypothetical protein
MAGAQSDVAPGSLRWAIALTLLVNALVMLTPLINEGDSVLYAALAQHRLHARRHWPSSPRTGAALCY